MCGTNSTLSLFGPLGTAARPILSLGQFCNASAQRLCFSAFSPSYVRPARVGGPRIHSSSCTCVPSLNEICLSWCWEYDSRIQVPVPQCDYELSMSRRLPQFWFLRSYCVRPYCYNGFVNRGLLTRFVWTPLFGGTRTICLRRPWPRRSFSHPDT